MGKTREHARRQTAAVRRCSPRGLSRAAVADALGVTEQAAHQRYRG